MPTLDRITLYPVKSLDGIDVEAARCLAGGALEHDRRWRLVDMDGRVLNAKRSPLFHAIRAAFSLDDRTVTLRVDPSALDAGALPAADRRRLAGLGRDTFRLVPGRGGPCAWLAEAFGADVLLEERADGGFPDDRESPGPTLVSTATLHEVGRWFGFDLGESRRRFRANLEIGGCDAFWEDTLASPARRLPAVPGDLPADPYADLPPGEPPSFSIGGIRMVAANVCRRCVVPSRDDAQRRQSPTASQPPRTGPAAGRRCRGVGRPLPPRREHEADGRLPRRLARGRRLPPLSIVPRTSLAHVLRAATGRHALPVASITPIVRPTPTGNFTGSNQLVDHCVLVR
ncbi:MAG: hypothetical protein EBX36_01740 [Planctomycetia bacterium]|nr:hypothetical protein [Planctomycetia bacterium]